MTVPAGLHIVTKRKRGKPITHYVYAWRGGPQILKKVGGSKPEVTAELSDLAADARKTKPVVTTALLSELIEKREGSAEFRKLSASQKANHMTWHRRIATEFGTTPVQLFGDDRIRGDVLDWRDRWCDQPRSADAAMEAFRGILECGRARGVLSKIVLLGVNGLYDNDRSDLIWEDRHFTAFAPEASVEVQEGVDLAAATGLRRGDLVRLPRAAVGEHAIVWKTSKSRGRKMITVPLLPEAKAVIARIVARHTVEMGALPAARRKPLPATVLANSFWEPWTPGGFGSRFNDAKKASGIDVHLHDLRGTFATRCMMAGLTDQEIADILGWDTKDVAKIRAKYVSQTRVVIALGERIAAARASAR
jgi:hypothetical protein